VEPLAKYFVEVRSYATPPLGRGSKGSTRANMSGDGAVFERLLFALRIFWQWVDYPVFSRKVGLFTPAQRISWIVDGRVCQDVCSCPQVVIDRAPAPCRWQNSFALSSTRLFFSLAISEIKDRC